MKYDNRYENWQIGFRDNKEGVIRGLNKSRCSQCRASTYWIDINSKKVVCSEECKIKIKND